MSDGPHKSLPLQRRWQDLAERAANPAFSDVEVAEAMLVAIRKEYGGLPIEKLRTTMHAGDQDGMFSETVEENLDALRVLCPGHAGWNALIDCCIDEIRRGGNGAEAMRAGCQAAIDLKLMSASRQIEEHYLRQRDNRSAFSLHQRLSVSRHAVDTASISSEICDAASRSPSNARIRKLDGLDEGVSI
jgi:hypothetical protein